MVEANRAHLSRRLPIFGAVVIVGWLAWVPLGDTLSAWFCQAADFALAPLTLGKGGHVRLEFAPAAAGQAQSTDTDPTWNGRLRLRVDGVLKEHSVRVNPRRLTYLPAVLLAALVAAAPMSRRRRGLTLGAGLLALLAIGVASVWVTAAWVFARVPGLVYELSGFEQSLLNFGYEALVTPLGNRLIVPFFLVAPALLWRTRRFFGSNEANAPTGRSAGVHSGAARGAK